MALIDFCCVRHLWRFLFSSNEKLQRRHAKGVDTFSISNQHYDSIISCYSVFKYSITAFLSSSVNASPK